MPLSPIVHETRVERVEQVVLGAVRVGFLGRGQHAVEAGLAPWVAFAHHGSHHGSRIVAVGEGESPAAALASCLESLRSLQESIDEALRIAEAQP